MGALAREEHFAGPLARRTPEPLLKRQVEEEVVVGSIALQPPALVEELTGSSLFDEQEVSEIVNWRDGADSDGLLISSKIERYAKEDICITSSSLIVVIHERTTSCFASFGCED